MKFVTMAPLEMVTGAVSLVRLSLASNAPVKWSPHVFQPVAMGFWLRTKHVMWVTMKVPPDVTSAVSWFHTGTPARAMNHRCVCQPAGTAHSLTMNLATMATPMMATDAALTVPWLHKGSIALPKVKLAIPLAGMASPQTMRFAMTAIPMMATAVRQTAPK